MSHSPKNVDSRKKKLFPDVFAYVVLVKQNKKNKLF